MSQRNFKSAIDIGFFKSNSRATNTNGNGRTQKNKWNDAKRYWGIATIPWEIFSKYQHIIEHPTSSLKINLPFDAIAKSFKRFKGDCHVSIVYWLRHFNEQSEIFKFSPLEKFVFAKQLMDGTAKSFIEFESRATSFDQLAKELIDEIGKSVNSALFHQKLQEWRKEKDETPIQYL